MSKRTRAPIVKRSVKKNENKMRPGVKFRRAPGSGGFHLYRNIGVAYTLLGAMEKAGRHPTYADLSPIENAALVEKNGRIVWIGEEKNLPATFRNPLKNGGRQTDLKKAAVIPGLVECHTHLIYAGNRAAEFERRLRGESYQSIAQKGGGILATVLPTREAPLASLVRIGQARAERFVRQGVTTIEAKSGYGLTVDSEIKLLRAAAKIRGPRIVSTFLGAHAVPTEFSDAAEYLQVLRSQAFSLLRREKLASRVDLFLEKGYFDKELARSYLNEAKSAGFDLVIHADQLSRSGGAELAVELGARSADHLLQINSDDIRRLADSEVTCVLLPTSDLYMKCNYPPARALIDQGARVALATDLNPGTAPSQDIALTGLLARLHMGMTFAEVLIAYIIGGVFALGLQDETGVLSVGRACDFAVLAGPLEELFLEVGRMPVEFVVCRGKKL